MSVGILYLFNAMLVLAELIVWFLPTVMRVSLIYGSPEVSCNKRTNRYFGKRSASLMKKFWILCIFVMTVSETVMVETIPYIFEYWSYTLFVDL